METRARSIVKAAIWTLTGFLTMSAIGFAITGSWSLGGQMAVLNSGIGLVSYILYERFWDRIVWGRDG